MRLCIPAETLMRRHLLSEAEEILRRTPEARSASGTSQVQGATVESNEDKDGEGRGEVSLQEDLGRA